MIPIRRTPRSIRSSSRGTPSRGSSTFFPLIPEQAWLTCRRDARCRWLLPSRSSPRERGSSSGVRDRLRSGILASAPPWRTTRQRPRRITEHRRAAERLPWESAGTGAAP
jgi:hypothetical protein